MKYTVYLLLIGLLTTVGCSQKKGTHNSKRLIESESKEIYDYAYPLVMMKLSQDLMLNNPLRPHKITPNHFIMFPKLAQPKNKAVVLGNRNTLYCVGWIDLSKGPVVFKIPDMNERYYVMPLIDAWTNTFESFGSRTTGQKAQNYLLTLDDYAGEIPEGFQQIVCPTSMVWITGRIEADSDADAKKVNLLQAQYELKTLEEYNGGKDPFSDYQATYSAKDIQKPVPYTLGMSAEEFYNVFLEMLTNNPPLKSDTGMTQTLKDWDVLGKSSYAEIPEKSRVLLDSGLKAKQKEYLTDFYKGKKQNSAWIFNLEEMGTWGTDYSRRAYWAMWGLGANLVEDAVYGVSQLDEDLTQLTGTSVYKIHFDKGETPDVGGFWSITAYDIEGYLELNDQKRYATGSNMDLTYNSDGSLDIYMSATRPKNVPELNWVPTPKNKYKILFRMYWPKKDILDGEWKIPSIQKIK